MIRKFSYKLRDEAQGFKEVLEEAIHENYKKMDGIPTATKVTVLREGKKFIDSTPTKVTYPKKIKDSEFKKP